MLSADQLPPSIGNPTSLLRHVFASHPVPSQKKNTHRGTPRCAIPRMGGLAGLFAQHHTACEGHLTPRLQAFRLWLVPSNENLQFWFCTYRLGSQAGQKSLWDTRHSREWSNWLPLQRIAIILHIRFPKILYSLGQVFRGFLGCFDPPISRLVGIQKSERAMGNDNELLIEAASRITSICIRDCLLKRHILVLYNKSST